MLSPDLIDKRDKKEATTLGGKLDPNCANLFNVPFL